MSVRLGMKFNAPIEAIHLEWIGAAVCADAVAFGNERADDRIHNMKYWVVEEWEFLPSVRPADSCDRCWEPLDNPHPTLCVACYRIVSDDPVLASDAGLVRRDESLLGTFGAHSFINGKPDR